MFTGLLPRHHQLIINGMALDPELPTLASRLSEAGYRTHGVGKQHLQPLLAPAEYNMPDSRAFWAKPESAAWNGPFYGFEPYKMSTPVPSERRLPIAKNIPIRPSFEVPICSIPFY